MKRLLITITAAVTFAGWAIPSLALDCAVEQRAFKHATGETCIPANPSRIVAPRGSNVATPLMDIGAPVIGTGFREMDDGTKYVRVASDVFGDEFVTNYGLSNVGNPNKFDIEAVAALKPDLIILNQWQAENAEKTDSIAPTIVVPSNLPFLEHLEWLADAVNMKGVYDGRVAAYKAKIGKAKAIIGDPSAISVSRFDMWEDGLWYYPNWGAVDQVIDDLGFAKPAIQANATEGFNGLSFERIEEFDADILIASRAPRFGQTIEMLEEQWDKAAPFWRQLPGVAAGNLYWYERDVWVGYSFASLDASIDALVLLTAGRSFD